MSMNKYTLGTIVGAALLGLAKSKSGGRNDEQKERTFLKLQKVLPAILNAYPFKDIYIVEDTNEVFMKAKVKNIGRYALRREYREEPIIHYFIQDVSDNLWKTGDEDLKRVANNGNMNLLPPTGGVPQDKTGRIWSVKQKKFVPLESVAPEPYAYCDQPTQNLDYSDGPAFISLGDNLPPLFMSHGLSNPEKLDKLMECGGFITPSIALTWRVPVAYPNITFLFSTKILDKALDKKKGSNLYLYNTDTWTPTVSMVIENQKMINEQRRGEISHYVEHRKFFTQNDPMDYDPEEMIAIDAWRMGARQITSLMQLKSNYKTLLKHHSKNGNPYEYKTRDERFEYAQSVGGDYVARYPYMEIKSTEFISLASPVAIVYIDIFEDKIQEYVSKTDYQGFLVPFSVNNPEDPMEIAQKATEAILDLKENPERYRNGLGDLRNWSEDKLDLTLNMQYEKTARRANDNRHPRRINKYHIPSFFSDRLKVALRRKDPELKQIESVREKERKIQILKQQMQQENNAEGLEVVGYMLEELKNKETFVLSQQEVGYFNEVLGKNFSVEEVITF